MCDTFVALSNATRDGSVLFGKNSDREPNEAQCVVTQAARDYIAGAAVNCTYIQIPQVHHTHAVLLSKPFWMWGAEMGSNEFGLTIGNEAVFTRAPYEKEGGLTGMDLLRLALERAASAEEGLKTITTLLETHGQGGNCGFAHPFYYHNSFLIADPKEAWILETVGRQWAAIKIKDVGAISNHLTIGEEWDLCSEGLITDAVERRLFRKGKPFNFRKVYTDPLITTFSDAGSRNHCTLDYLKNQLNALDLTGAMNLLRNHRDGSTDWSPDAMVSGSDVCMHAGFGPVRINQTVGSLVTQLTARLQTHWVTGTAAPCLSTFKPIWIDSGAPAAYSTDSETYDGKSLWWRHEILHRLVLKNYPGNLAGFGGKLDERERYFIKQAALLSGKSPVEREEFSLQRVKQNLDDLREWVDLIRKKSNPEKTVFYYKMTWEQFSKEAVMSKLL